MINILQLVSVTGSTFYPLRKVLQNFSNTENKAGDPMYLPESSPCKRPKVLVSEPGSVSLSPAALPGDLLADGFQGLVALASSKSWFW